MHKKSNGYQYLRIPGGQRMLFCSHQKLFCLQTNPLILAWVLRMLYQKDILYYPNRKKKGITALTCRWFPAKQQYKLILRILVLFIKNKLHLINQDNMIGLPIYGQICVPVHTGYKIFDFRREAVVKVFEDNVSTSYIRHQIEQLKNTSKFYFAPSIKKWNIDERWYEEDYHYGWLDWFKFRNSNDILNKFGRDIVPCIGRLIFSRPPIVKNINEHIAEIIVLFESNLNKCHNLTLDDSNIIKNYVNSMVERLCAEEDFNIYLFLTHGDFCPANMVNTKNGIIIIDWESTSFRSALFDFYSYFFFRSVHQELPVDALVSEIRIALSVLCSRLATKSLKISKNLESLAKVYRLFYYIERICMQVERKRSEVNLDIIAIIKKFIEVSNQYEERTGKSP